MPSRTIYRTIFSGDADRVEEGGGEVGWRVADGDGGEQGGLQVLQGGGGVAVAAPPRWRLSIRLRIYSVVDCGEGGILL